MGGYNDRVMVIISHDHPLLKKDTCGCGLFVFTWLNFICSQETQSELKHCLRCCVMLPRSFARPEGGASAFSGKRCRWSRPVAYPGELLAPKNQAFIASCRVHFTFLCMAGVCKVGALTDPPESLAIATPGTHINTTSYSYSSTLPFLQGCDEFSARQ
jgi:hypothetical protein